MRERAANGGGTGAETARNRDAPATDRPGSGRQGTRRRPPPPRRSETDPDEGVTDPVQSSTGEPVPPRRTSRVQRAPYCEPAVLDDSPTNSGTDSMGHGGGHVRLPLNFTNGWARGHRE